MLEIFLSVHIRPVFVEWVFCSLVAVALSGFWTSVVAVGSLADSASVG